MRLTDQTVTKVGHSDPVILSGKVIAQRIKGTPGMGRHRGARCIVATTAAEAIDPVC